MGGQIVKGGGSEGEVLFGRHIRDAGVASLAVTSIRILAEHFQEHCCKRICWDSASKMRGSRTLLGSVLCQGLRVGGRIQHPGGLAAGNVSPNYALSLHSSRSSRRAQQAGSGHTNLRQWPKVFSPSGDAVSPSLRLSSWLDPYPDLCDHWLEGGCTSGWPRSRQSSQTGHVR